MTKSIDGMVRCDDGVMLAYTVTGEGHPVVLVNGLGNLKEAWNKTVANFSRYFLVVTYNLRNQGHDVMEHGSSYGTDQHVADLMRLLEHLAIEKTVGIGISTGTRILAEFAVRYPERTRALVLMGITTENLNHRNRLIFSSWLNALSFGNSDCFRRYIEAYFPWIYGPDYLSKIPLPIDQLSRNLAATMTKAGTAANIGASLRSLSPTTSLRRPIEVPTLLLQGEYDLLGPPGCLQGLTKKFNDYHLEVLPRAGHNIRVEDRLSVERYTMTHLLDRLGL